MNSADRQRVKELLSRAASLAPHERAAFIEQAADGDREIATEALELIQTLDDSAFMSAPTGAGVTATLVPAAALHEGPGTRIGRYKLLQLIGEGGFGSVFMAEQTEPVVRRVALKIIKAGMDTKQVIARFEAERQALALMDHPNIARVLDAGATDTGRPYFVMELVRGEPVTAYCDRERLSVQQRLELFRDVCHAVQHAHQKGIIHRDLKPTNVLVTVANSEPLPKVIDFGIAKATAGRLTDKTLFTELHQLIGTPQYMSPEQAEVSGVDIDTRTDVYALGVLLYELLAGSTPLEVGRLRAAPLPEIQRLIREEDPPRPSLRLQTLAASSGHARFQTPLASATDSADSSVIEIARRRRSEPSLLTRALRGDLDWIVMKCLEKDRRRRYATASAVAEDVGRYLAHQPVLATPPSTGYRLRKFVRRNRGLVLAAGAIAATLVLATGVSILFALDAMQERGRAEMARLDETTAREEADTRRAAEELQRRQAEEITEFVTQALVSSDPHQGGTQGFLVTVAMDQAIALLDGGALKEQPETEAALRLTLSEILNGNARSEDALRLAQRALEINQEIHAGDHPAVATSLDNLAACLQSLGRRAEALPRFQAALEMRQRLFSGDHPDLAASLTNLANCLESVGRAVEALPSFEAALAMYQRLFHGDHRAIACSLNGVGYCLFSLGRWAEALPQYEAALEMRQRLFPGDHPDVAYSLNNLAGCLQSMGRPTEALPNFEAVLEMHQRLFQGAHPAVAMSLAYLADCLGSLGRQEEALLRHEAALEMYQRLFPGDHPSVARSLNNVGGCLRRLGKSADALPKLEAALAMLQRLFPGDHPDVAMALSNLAALLQTLDRSAEALPYAEVALEMYRRVLPPGHPHALYPQLRLARTLVTLGRHADADPLLRDASEQCERSEASRRLHWREVLESSVRLYDAWHAAEPDQGHDAQAAEWRGKLVEWQASTQPTSPSDTPP